MTTALTAAEAIRILQAAGIPAKQQKAPAGMCPTLCYRINGKPCNLAYLRQIASEQA